MQRTWFVSLHRPRNESRRLPADGPGIGIRSVEAGGGPFRGEPVDLNRVAHGGVASVLPVLPFII